MRQFDMNKAINHKKHVFLVYWYKSIKVGFIEKYSYLAKNSQKMARMPTFLHTFFGHNLAFFGLIGLKIFMGTIIYRLVVRNQSFDVCFSVFNFGPLSAGKWAWPSRAPLKVQGCKTVYSLKLIRDYYLSILDRISRLTLNHR